MSKFGVLIISFFLAFTTTFVHAKDQEVLLVTDVHGNLLRSGARYYMAIPFAPDLMPAMVSDTSHGACPSGYIILSDFSKKLPISVSEVESNSTFIFEGTYVTVRFNFGYLCKILISLVWKVGDGDRLRTGGVEGLNRFKITKYGGENSNKYQLDACPVSECLHECTCYPVGRAEEGEVSYLAAGREPPIPIVFVPADEEPRIADKLSSM